MTYGVEHDILAHSGADYLRLKVELLRTK